MALQVGERIGLAHDRIRSHIVETPCSESELLGRELEADVFLKLENQQITGSFKLRGVVNKIRSLKESDAEKMLVAASTGNHGAAFAFALRTFKRRGKLFVPQNIAPVKLKALRDLGASLAFVGTDCVETEVRAKRFAKETGGVFISPYNDWDIVYGQGTVGFEINDQIKEVDVVFVPVGGGGLVSGVSAYLKNVSPQTHIVGCQPFASAVMAKSIEAGRIVTMESLPTLSDATAGGIEPEAITFALCQKYVDEFVLLTEEEILSALELMATRLGLKVEGAAAMTVAAAQKIKTSLKGKRVVLVISGSRVDPVIFKRLGQNDGSDNPHQVRLESLV